MSDALSVFIRLSCTAFMRAGSLDACAAAMTASAPPSLAWRAACVAESAGVWPGPCGQAGCGWDDACDGVDCANAGRAPAARNMVVKASLRIMSDLGSVDVEGAGAPLQWIRAT